MTDLIERMALAISDTGLLAGDESMDAARAAMSEIRETHDIVPREPTEAMIESAMNCLLSGFPRQEIAASHYRAMINAGELLWSDGDDDPA